MLTYLNSSWLKNSRNDIKSPIDSLSYSTPFVWLWIVILIIQDLISTSWLQIIFFLIFWRRCFTTVMITWVIKFVGKSSTSLRLFFDLCYLKKQVIMMRLNWRTYFGFNIRKLIDNRWHSIKYLPDCHYWALLNSGHAGDFPMLPKFRTHTTSYLVLIFRLWSQTKGYLPRCS